MLSTPQTAPLSANSVRLCCVTQEQSDESCRLEAALVMAPRIGLFKHDERRLRVVDGKDGLEL
jgi:hypothetical protein